MTECQGCGAWNERHRALCVLCGTPLAETDEWDASAELPPLPPLPDGGLSVTMPAWLRAEPGDPESHPAPTLAPLEAEEETVLSVPAAAAPLAEDGDAAVDAFEPPAEPEPVDLPLGPQADPRTFLRDEDFPRWIRDLPVLPPRRVPPVTVLASPAPELASSAEADAPPALIPQPDPAPPTQIALPPEPPPVEAEKPVLAPAVTAAPAVPPEAPERQREPWETPLLVVLVVGVVIAVVWALLINGLIGNGL